MTAALRGHPMICKGGIWFYKDTGEATAGNRRDSCGHCSLTSTPEGHDGCLGKLPRVKNACCGHGVVSDAYVQFGNGRRVAARSALTWLRLASRAAA